MASDLLKALGEGGESTEPDMAGAKQRAAKDVLRALKGGDASALSAALERHYEACSGSELEDEAY